MSRHDDYSLENNRREPEDRTPSALERTAEVSSRLGVTRDAAKLEMERFLGVAEYETRKLVGQHSVLRQPTPSAPARPTRRKRAASRPGAHSLQGRTTPEPQAAEAPGPAVEGPEPPPAGPDQTDPAEG